MYELITHIYCWGKKERKIRCSVGKFIIQILSTIDMNCKKANDDEQSFFLSFTTELFRDMPWKLMNFRDELVQY